MKINCLGGGPASLYFSILMKKAYPDAEIHVHEQNGPDDTFGFGVVFSDATAQGFDDADPESWNAMRNSFAHWDDIHIHFRGQVLKSTGHGFAGMSRKLMLNILQDRARELGVDLIFNARVGDPEALRDCDLLFCADGVNSLAREVWRDRFRPTVDFRPNRFVWLGTSFEFPAFTFHFRENEHGLWRTHCYRYMEGHSTFILECTDETFRRSGLEVTDEDATRVYAEAMFGADIDGRPLLVNRSHWRQFPHTTCENWHFDNVVLVGDAVATAHYSIGSGTKLAMEEAIALARAIRRNDNIPAALADYEATHRPAVESLQRSAMTSLTWFEETERYYNRLEPVQFGFSLLTRSLRISHENLKLRDPDYVGTIDAWFAGEAARAAGTPPPSGPPPPPMFTPFRLRDMALSNRIVVSPMCQYSAADGTIDDWHLVHIGSRALGGAGLVITEMTDVSAAGRISPGCAGMYRPEHVDAWRRVTAFVHRHSEAKIGIQLAHAGRKGSTRAPWDGDSLPLPDGNWPILAASALPYREESDRPREMTHADMEAVRDDFVRSTKMAVEAGFDMIELHFAHGYLLSTFISPLTNHRTDEWGGDLEGRMRFPLEVFDAVRAVWPDERPVSVRISATDWKDGGVDAALAVDVARMLKAHGCDIIDVSAGQVVSDQAPLYGRLFQTPFSERVRLEAGIPTMTVGAISSHEDVNSILAAGRADLCVLARAHLWDPYWTRHAAHAQDHDLPWPKQYAAVEGFVPRD